MPKSFTVDEDYNDSRLDKWFKDKIINLPHSLIEKIIRQKIKIDRSESIVCLVAFGKPDRSVKVPSSIKRDINKNDSF